MTRVGRWETVPNSRDLNCPFRCVDEPSAESLNRHPWFAWLPETNDATSDLTFAERVTFDVVPVVTLVELVAAGPGQSMLFSVQPLVIRPMFQVRFWFGAEERNTLSVALLTSAVAGIEQEERSNLTKLRLFLSVVIITIVVSCDWTWSVVAEPLFAPSS